MRILEGLGDGGVHVYGQLLVHGQLLVAGVSVKSHEVAEFAPDKTVNAVNYPLAGQSKPVCTFGKHDQDLGILFSLLEDFGQTETTVLGNIALADSVAVDTSTNYQLGSITYKFLLPCTMSRMNQMLMLSTCGR